jgi:hypothetical protein
MTFSGTIFAEVLGYDYTPGFNSNTSAHVSLNMSVPVSWGLTVTYEEKAVPEPCTLLLLASVAGIVLLANRRRRIA